MKIFLSIITFLTLSCVNSLYCNEIFKQLTIDDGLAHTDANCIAQDSTGLVWIGTYAGLQNYDGYSLQTFDYYPPEQKIFQSHNRILSLACTKSKLWLGTESGLTCFNLNTHRYTPYYIENKDTKYNFKSPISKLFTDPSGCHLWIQSSKEMIVAQIQNDTILPLKWDSEEERILGKGFTDLQFQGETIWATNGQHIAQLSIRNDKVCILHLYKVSELLQRKETVQSIYLINDFLYMRTGGGCYRISVTNHQLDKTTLVYTDFHSTDSRIPTYTNGKFIVSKEGTLWCAHSKGIFEIQSPFSDTPSIQEYLRNAKNDNQFALKIKDLLIDKYNNLWVTTNSWGVFYQTLSKPLFKNLSKQDFKEMGFSQNEIASVTGQANGVIWMIVEYASLFRYDPQTEELSLIPLQKDNSKTIYLQNVEISHDQKHLYIGTSNGIFIYDIHTKKTTTLPLTQSHSAQKIYASISYLQEDESGRLWVGTWGNGLFCISDPLTSPVVTLQLNTQTDPCILSNQITHIRIIGKSVFICTTNGLNRLLLTDTGKIKALSAYQINENTPATSMSTNYLACIDCNNDTVCWIGTIGGGLNKVVLHSERNNDYTATCYTTKNGLTSNDCEIVLTDNLGNVWIGGNGITQLDVPKNKIYTYSFADGLQNNAFKINVSYKDKDGTLYMGGLHGLSSFQPEHFTYDTNSYALMFSNLFINNQQIIPGNAYNGHIVLNKILDKTSKLTLNHLQNNFSISFTVLGYELSEQIMYRYRLKGFQKDWHTQRYTNNEIYFSNLPYGSYTLEIQLSTDRGYTWHTSGKELKITTLPPWWLSNYAKTAYVLFVITFIIIAFRQYNKEQNLKKENEIQKILIVQDQEKYQAKMQFFMNASHELKTPLTLILLAAEKFADENKQSKECKAILSNTKKMVALISELVDIRKTDLGISTLNPSHFNMSRITRQLFEEIKPWADNKHISITYTSDCEDLEIYADIEKIGKMIINLFSNAIKYTNTEGKIDISFRKGTLKKLAPHYATIHTEGYIDAEQPVCILTVRDTGIGISAESIRLIYERFFQVNESSKSHLGSGIGLTIVKNIVLQHKGIIIVSSERIVGTEFIVALPVCNYNIENKAIETPTFNFEEFMNEQYNEYNPEEEIRKEETVLIADNPNLPTLLLVEDNKELQVTLKEHLSVAYNIHIADNGQIGLKMCMSIFPDIIISDVMMPEMDGIEMCRRIKNNLSVAYIPIVLLTAKNNVESQIEGYESGADLYIPKPFSMKLLEVNLHRLLKQRQQVEAIKENNEISISNESPKSILNNEELRVMTEKLKRIIDENISNPELSPEQLSSALGVSRTKLYRDLKRIDGQSLADYVRNIRLEKAAYLLVNSNLNIQEVMNEVGFINSSHFTKIFKLKYEKTPSEYKKSMA